RPRTLAPRHVRRMGQPPMDGEGVGKALGPSRAAVLGRPQARGPPRSRAAAADAVASRSASACDPTARAQGRLQTDFPAAAGPNTPALRATASMTAPVVNAAGTYAVAFHMLVAVFGFHHLR